MLTLAAGLASLTVFVLWQRHLSRRPDGQPLIDLALFRSRSFTWGGILATLSTFVMFGVLFAMPQFFQAVLGADALGTGLRLLPIIGGLLVGAQLADRVAPRLGAARTVTLGFGLLAAGQLAGRARRRVRTERTVPDADLETQWAVLDAFTAAARDGDFDRLTAVLDPDAVLRADFGPDGGWHEVRGPAAVARQALSYARGRVRTSCRR